MSLRRLSLACQVVMCVSCESHVSTHVKDKVVVGASPGRERGNSRACRLFVVPLGSDRHRAVVAVRPAPGPPRPASGFPRCPIGLGRKDGTRDVRSTQPGTRRSNRGATQPAAARREPQPANRRACITALCNRGNTPHDHVPSTRQLSSRAGATELGARRQPRVPRSAPRGERPMCAIRPASGVAVGGGRRGASSGDATL